MWLVDKLGNELSVGDCVVATSDYGHWMFIAVIRGFQEDGRVLLDTSFWNGRRYTSKMYLRHPDKLIRVDTAIADQYFTYTAPPADYLGEFQGEDHGFDQ